MYKIKLSIFQSGWLYLDWPVLVSFLSCPCLSQLGLLPSCPPLEFFLCCHVLYSPVFILPMWLRKNIIISRWFIPESFFITNSAQCLQAKEILHCFFITAHYKTDKPKWLLKNLVSALKKVHLSLLKKFFLSHFWLAVSCPLFWTYKIF